MKRAPIALIASALALCGSARGATYSVTQVLTAVGPGGAATQPMLVAAVNAQVSGAVQVTFAADPATGCAALDGCGYSGEYVGTLGTGGQMTVIESGHGKRARFSVTFSTGAGPSPSTALYANVTRIGASRPCTDEVPGPDGIGARVVGDKLIFVLPTFLGSTRCAGPVASDLAALLPTVGVRAGRLLHGGLMLDFRASRHFAAHGFAGTLTSTVLVRLGRAHLSHDGVPNPSAPGSTSQGTREVIQAFSVTAARGAIVAAFRGTTNPAVCVLLDSCGLAGTLRLAPDPIPASAQGLVAALGPANRPYRDFLAALGLGHGNARGIAVFGTVGWNDAGRLSAQTRQSGTCSDTAGLESGYAAVFGHGDGLQVIYHAGDGESGGPRTRCPGPLLAARSASAVGVARFPLTPRQRFTVHLDAGGAFEDDGYAVDMHGQLSLTLRRGRLRQQVF